MLLMGYHSSFVDPTVFLPQYDTDYRSRNGHVAKYLSSEYVRHTSSQQTSLKEASGAQKLEKGTRFNTSNGLQDEIGSNKFLSQKTVSWQNRLPSCRNASSVHQDVKVFQKPHATHFNKSITPLKQQTSWDTKLPTQFPEITSSDEELLWTIILAIRNHLKCTAYESIQFFCFYWKLDSALLLQLLLKTCTGQSHNESTKLFYYKVLSLIEKLKSERNSQETDTFLTSLQNQFSQANLQSDYFHESFMEFKQLAAQQDPNYLSAAETNAIPYFTLPTSHHPFAADTIIETEVEPPMYRSTNSAFPHLEQSSPHPKIIEVWADDLEEEFKTIRDLVERYHYVAIDTEFPGVVATATKTGASDYQYQTVKCNVDLLNIIQLGITFSDEHGNFPSCGSTWQFNFKFDLERDLYAEDSIELLKSHGIDFHTHQEKGIDIHAFGECIISSGLVMCDNIKWISFHGSYDFGYLLKLLTCSPLPDTEDKFFELLHDHFPSFCDVKYLLRSCPNTRHITSLDKASNFLNILRVGQRHQAGSDSLVTSQTFLKLRELYFNTPDHRPSFLFSGVLFGLRKGRIVKKPYLALK